MQSVQQVLARKSRRVRGVVTLSRCFLTSISLFHQEYLINLCKPKIFSSSLSCSFIFLFLIRRFFFFLLYIEESMEERCWLGRFYSPGQRRESSKVTRESHDDISQGIFYFRFHFYLKLGNSMLSLLSPKEFTFYSHGYSPSFSFSSRNTVSRPILVERVDVCASLFVRQEKKRKRSYVRCHGTNKTREKGII